MLLSPSRLDWRRTRIRKAHRRTYVYLQRDKRMKFENETRGRLDDVRRTCADEHH